VTARALAIGFAKNPSSNVSISYVWKIIIGSISRDFYIYILNMDLNHCFPFFYPTKVRKCSDKREKYEWDEKSKKMLAKEWHSAKKKPKKTGIPKNLMIRITLMSKTFEVSFTKVFWSGFFQKRFFEDVSFKDDFFEGVCFKEGFFQKSFFQKYFLHRGLFWRGFFEEISFEGVYFEEVSCKEISFE
jgi:hypothetical protein